MSAPTVSAMPSSAPSPFDREDADMILRTSDNVEFRVYRNILSMASSFFDTMFSLPQSGSQSDSDLQAVDVTEDSRTMETLLRVCYPVVEPTVCVLEDARAVLEAALKYEMDRVIASAKRWLFALITEHPLRIYAIACRHEVEDIARPAALEAIKQRAVSDVYIPELEEISAGCYHRLLQYQRGGLPDASNFLFCHSGRAEPRDESEQGDEAEQGHEAKQGEAGYSSRDAPSPFDNADADVVIVTVDMVHFHVSRDFVASASPVLKRMLEAQDGVSTNKVHSKDPEAALILHVDDNSDILYVLLQLYHPSGTPALDDTHSLPSLLVASARYEMEKAFWILRQRWSDFAASQPLQSYLLASSHGWKKEAIHSAKVMLSQDFDSLQKSYVDDLETIMAGPYFRLLQYHKRCGEMAETFTSGNFWSHPQIAGKKYTCNHCSPSYGNAYQPPSCMASYTPGISADLRKRPCAATVTSGPKFAAWMIQILSSWWCKQNGEQILSFVYTLGHAVDEEVAKVDTQMLFLA